MPKTALDVALFFLKFRPRSVFEIRKKLEVKKIEVKEIEQTIAVLKHNELLDDAKFAKMYVADRNRFKPSGSYVLRMELKRLGLSEIDIDNALAEQDEESLAREAIESKSKYRNGEFEKQAAFLQRRGFGMQIILKILNDLKRSGDESGTDSAKEI